MSDRERWIVYPLLFLSLGASLRPKLAPSPYIEADHIACNVLQCKGLEVKDVLLANQLGTDKAPVNAAWVKNFASVIVRCDVLYSAHRLFDLFDPGRQQRPKTDTPRSDQPKSGEEKSEAPAGKPAINMQ